MYSYYDILTLMKYNKHPKKVLVHCENDIVHYEFNEECKCYLLVHDELFNENELGTWYSYLSDYFSESMMFKKCIEIVEEQIKYINFYSFLFIDQKNNLSNL